jgi:hypothetical protein
VTALRPNYRRARELASEIEAVKDALHDANGDPAGASRSDSLRAELYELQHELFRCGVPSEFDL